MKLFNKSKVACFLIIVILLTSLGPIFPKKAEAQWVVFDATNIAKEYGLDSIAFIIANAIIQRIAASTVNWINTGFKGSPAFVTNPDQFFGNLGNGIAGQLLYNNPNTRFMCSGFKTKVQLALGNSYRNNINPFQCTLTGVARNFDNFMNDFSQGGWEGFIQITQNNQNNPIGLYNTWNSQILNEQNRKIQQKQTELNHGRGFLSVQTCAKWSQPLSRDVPSGLGANIGGSVDPETGIPIDTQDPTDYEGYDSPVVTDDLVPGANTPVCEKRQASTPGAVIETQLNGVLGSGGGRLQVADEFNEIISSLLNQLVGQLVGGIGKGLRSLSSPSGPGGSNQTYTTQLGNDAATQSTISGGSGCNLGPGSTVLGIIDPATGQCVSDPNAFGTKCNDLITGAKGRQNGAGQCLPDITAGQACNDVNGVASTLDGWGECILVIAPVCVDPCPADDPNVPGAKTIGQCDAAGACIPLPPVP